MRKLGYMREKEKKDYSKWVGFGLMRSVAIGYGFGSMLSRFLYAPIYSAAGAGVGIVTGSIIGHTKIRGK